MLAFAEAFAKPAKLLMHYGITGGAVTAGREGLW